MNNQKDKRIKPVTKLWKMRDGTEIRMCDMDDSHLKNTIRMLQRLAVRVHDARILEGYMVLGSVNGEMAYDCIDNELHKMQEDGPDPMQLPPYPYLVKEAKRRGLEV